MIRAALQKLAASDRAEVRNEGALAFLSRDRPPVDIVFSDPPFDAGLLAPALAQLPRVLKPANRVYAEWPLAEPLPWPPG